VRVVLQRVREAAVAIDGAVSASIRRGYVLLVAFTHDDAPPQVQWMADKIRDLRLFPDHDGKMNRSITEVGGSVLVVSQFTLYGDARKGRRPSFVAAASPAVAEPLYSRFVQSLQATGLRVETGVFAAAMDVSLVNDGPVTLLLER